MEQVVLVDSADNPVGTMEKMQAHQMGRLHRALSVFVFDEQKRLLLQQRALCKYHNGGIWSNTVCSHPRPNEDVLAAAGRRLIEELGFFLPLREVGTYTYLATFANGLTEHEYDHVFVGTYQGQQIKPNPPEVAQTIWLTRGELMEQITAHPERFSVWMRGILERPFFRDLF